MESKKFAPSEYGYLVKIGNDDDLNNFEYLFVVADNIAQACDKLDIGILDGNIYTWYKFEHNVSVNILK